MPTRLSWATMTFTMVQYYCQKLKLTKHKKMSCHINYYMKNLWKKKEKKKESARCYMLWVQKVETLGCSHLWTFLVKKNHQQFCYALMSYLKCASAAMAAMLAQSSMLPSWFRIVTSTRSCHTCGQVQKCMQCTRVKGQHAQDNG